MQGPSLPRGAAIRVLTKFVVQVNNMMQQRVSRRNGGREPTGLGAFARGGNLSPPLFKLFVLVRTGTNPASLKTRPHRPKGGDRSHDTQTAIVQSALDPPHLQRRAFRRCLGRGDRALQHRSRARRGSEGRRAAAALRLSGRHRPGLPARRRYRGWDSEGHGPAFAADHECRHRDQCRGRARSRRETDRRGRPASGRRLRFRAEHGHRAGGRAEGHPLRHQYRRRPADHRAGLQVRVPQLPHRRHDPARRLRRPEANLCGGRRRAQDGGVHACQRHFRHRDERRYRRGDAEVRHAVQDRRDDRLRSGGARSVGGNLQGQGDRRRCAAVGQPPQRRHPAHPRNGQAALDADGDHEHGPGLVRGPVPQDAGQAFRRAAEFRALVRSEQEDVEAARGRARQGACGRQLEHQPRLHLRGAADRRRRLQARRLQPIRRRSPTPSASPTSRTMSASVPASSSTPRARTTRSWAAASRTAAAS